MTNLLDKRDALLARLRPLGRCAVAFSGGVDSAVVLNAAYLALGQNTIALTGLSASVAQRERDTATDVARRIGVKHEFLTTHEFDQHDYVRNAHDRCYHCKTELYTQMTAYARARGIVHLLNGTNADDLGDYRPGLRAADEFHVHSPLAELGFTKEDVRGLARGWQLTVWDKPAAPCLSSRVVYGLAVSPTRLARIEQAESFLIARGFPVVRVRLCAEDLARIEVPADRLSALTVEPLRSELVTCLRGLGFRRMTLDLEGFRSGNLNESANGD